MVVRPSGRDVAGQAPSVTIVVGIVNGPAGRHAAFEVDAEAVAVTTRRRRASAAARISPAQDVVVVGRAFGNTSVALAGDVLPFALCPGAHARAVDGGNLADVVLTLDEIVGGHLAERLGGGNVGVEDGLAVDGGAHHLEVLEVTLVALRTSGQDNVVDPDLIHVIILMVEGNPHVLASVGAQVNRV